MGLGRSKVKLRIVAFIILSLISIFIICKNLKYRHNSTCDYNLKQICTAIKSYKDFFYEFPPPCLTTPEGRPGHSWRRLVLPYTDYVVDLSKYDLTQSWDSPKNEALTKLGLLIFQCPNDSDSINNFTSYFAIKDYCNKDMFVIIEIHGASIEWSRPEDFDIGGLRSIVQGNPRIVSQEEPVGLAVIGSFCSLTRIQTSGPDDFFAKLDIFIKSNGKLSASPKEGH